MSDFGDRPDMGKVYLWLTPQKENGCVNNWNGKCMAERRGKSVTFTNKNGECIVDAMGAISCPSYKRIQENPQK